MVVVLVVGVVAGGGGQNRVQVQKGDGAKKTWSHRANESQGRTSVPICSRFTGLGVRRYASKERESKRVYKVKSISPEPSTMK